MKYAPGAPPSYVPPRERNYQARVWRDGVLKREAVQQAATMLAALTPAGFRVDVEECDDEVPGFPYAPRYKFRATIHDPSGQSDAHHFVRAYTRDGAEAVLLGALLDRANFYPLT